jgi:hypothetical protein
MYSYMRHIIITALFLLIALSASSQSNRIYWWQMKWAPVDGDIYIPASNPANGRFDLYPLDSVDLDTRIDSFWTSADTLYARVIRVSGGVTGPVDTLFTVLPQPDLGNYLQIGDNVSELQNDAGYVSETDGLTLAGDVTGTGSYSTDITTTIANNAVTNTKLRTSSGYSVIGRGTNTTGNVADISATTNHHVLRLQGGTLGFGLLSASSIAVSTDRVPYAVADALTSSANFTYNGTNLTVATGSMNASSGFQVNSLAPSGQYLRGNGTNFVTSDLTASDLALNSISNTLIRQSTGLSVVGRSANSTGNVADITAATDLHVLRRSGSSIGFGLLTGGSISLTSTQIPFGSTGNVQTSNSQFLFQSSPANRPRVILDSSPSGRLEFGLGSDFYGVSNQTVFAGFSSLNESVPALNFLGLKHGGSFAALTDYTTGPSSALVAFSGMAYLSGNPRIAAAILFNGDGVSSATSYSGRIVFTTSNGAGAVSERMRINKDGQVGIGTTTMTSLLDVAGDVEIPTANAFYLGDPTTDGTWRIIRSGNDLLSQRRESGSYVTKQTITP